MKVYSKLFVLFAMLPLLTACNTTGLYEYPSSDDLIETYITGFSLVNESEASVISGSAVIDRASGTVTVKAIAGTDLTRLYPRASVSEGVVVEPKMGYATNFSSPVKYTLTAGDRKTTQTWTVTVTN
ncbi:MAG: hypothetical protein LBR84_02710 [Tannerella sp.]|jgi:hypothetical protein|nr:hypothetical protein [Tannerella sp.]